MLAALLAALALVAASCDNGEKKGSGSTTRPEDEGKPQMGGEIVFGLEAETGGGFCPPEAQWAAAGIQVGNAVFDPLVTLDEEGNVVPFLAKSVTQSPDATQFTFEIREGITFHDGTPLDAAVVKRNIDAWYGAAEPIGLLIPIIVGDIESVEVTAPMTVVVTTKRPWPAFLNRLADGRFVIASPKQLDGSLEDCKNKPIGTGPFKFVSWTPDEKFVAEKNADYWLHDADGNALPYVDKITFVPITEPLQRENQLDSGQLNIMTTSAEITADSLEKKADEKQIKLYVGDTFRELAYYMLNARSAPFDNLTARRALAAAIDREALNALVNKGRATITNEPFDEDSGGYLPQDDVGWAKYDPDEAKKLVAQYKSETGQDIKVTVLTTDSSDNRKEADLLKNQLEEVGMTVDFNLVDQTQIINTALAGQGWSLLLWRNNPGQLNSDTQYSWWYSGFPTNFGGFKDPEIDRLLDEARVELDAEKRNELYQELNKRFAEQVWNIWTWYANWYAATATDVNGVAGPTLPDSDAKSILVYAGYVPVAGLWISK